MSYEFSIKGFSAKQIADICGVDEATARRWRRRAICPPKSALVLLELRFYADLGAIDPAWAGWLLRRGVLVSPEGWEASPGDVRAMQLHHALVSAQRTEISRLRRDLSELERTGPWLDEQPLPGSVDFKLG